MESLRRLIEQIIERYRLLETSQKVAIGLCVVVIVGSLVSLMHWSTRPDLVPIMAKDFTFDQMDAAEETLSAAGITYERSGRRLLVRDRDKYNAVRVLNSADALPQDFAFGFAKLMDDDSTFKPSSVLEHQRQVALGYELARVIASSPAVEHAFVLIQQQRRRTIGRPRVKPSASVKLTMRPGKPVTPATVEGCARLVATAVAGLSPHDVTVFDTRTLKAHVVPSPDELLNHGLLEERKKNEQYLLAKVLDQLSYIPGVLASVSVELDGSKSRTESISYGEAEVMTEESKTSKSGSVSNPAETGVNPNVGVALNAGGGGVDSETEDSRTENFEPKMTEHRVEDKAPFAPKRATAAINIPRSYLLSVFETRYPDQAGPRETDREFIAVRDEIFAGVRDAVKIVLQAESDGDVRVDMFYDTAAGGMLGGLPGSQAALAGALTTTERVKSYAPQIGLGALAMFSILMMMLMVRKTTRAARHAFPESAPGQVPDGVAVAPDGTLTVAGGPVGRAEASEGFLVGQEVDEETLRHKQLDEQVARLVDDDPAGVADLLRRWVEQEE